MISNARRTLTKPLGACVAAMLFLTAGQGLGAGGVHAEGAEPYPMILNVADYGAVANDGADDAPAIQLAIQAAASSNSRNVLAFEEGVYNLGTAAGEEAMLRLSHMRNVTVRGATYADGAPATALQVNLPLGNDVSGAAAAGHFFIENAKNVKLENLILDYGPRFATAGEIVSVDRASDTVVVDIFPGMPHFDGMKAYSANSWDLETGMLLPVDALTIGTDKDGYFATTWSKVQDGSDDRYRISGMGFSNRVEVGQGISWHFNVDTANPNLRVMYSENITLENVRIYNSLGMSMLAGYNKNFTVKNVRVEPQGSSLAVGPRDAFHFSNNRGQLLMDEVYVKGVRWDPLVSRSTFVEVKERIDDYSIRTSYGVGSLSFDAGDTVAFWVGDQPFERVIASAANEGGVMDVLTFADPLPDTVKVGSRLTHQGYEWDQVILRNSTVEGNFGTALVFMNKNLLVENSVFRNNAYSNIGLGPTSVNTGPFARNVVIQNNLFEQSTWIQKYNSYDGTITTFENHASFNKEKYNDGIVIRNNTFKDLHIGAHATAVHLKNARNVELSGNTYINVNHPIKVNIPSTENIVNNDGVPVVEERGDAALPAEAIVVDPTSPQYKEVVGSWALSGLTGYNGSITRYSGTAGGAATWTPNLEAGTYQVLAYRIVHPASEPATKLAVHHAGGVTEVVSDFTAGQSGWIELGTFEFAEGAGGFVRMSRANPQQAVSYLRTNAVAFIPAND
ncbi:hypothetical protein FE782_15220 [Paenibacillus antri]|uniref:Golvesin/Xly CBD-like domain-containing protein n=1 Tax=Paenibacillus antri TaxID=2582848 RepID=A0A5R9G8R2_9BACL|nr:hypothetical protein [Paenibacillus antri]TLS51459.1 hypothetical protein FE782_15220 [Paenibacillus antri]